MPTAAIATTAALLLAQNDDDVRTLMATVFLVVGFVAAVAAVVALTYANVRGGE